MHRKTNWTVLRKIRKAQKINLERNLIGEIWQRTRVFITSIVLMKTSQLQQTCQNAHNIWLRLSLMTKMLVIQMLLRGILKN